MWSESVPADETVCVIGLGYVGMTLTAVLADVGFQVTGVDHDSEIVRRACRADPHFHEAGLADMLDRLPIAFRTALTAPCATAYVITVGTPVLPTSRHPDLTHVRHAARGVGQVLKPGDLVLLRSTVPVGTTRGVVVRALEDMSGLRAGVDFDVAYCPERTAEGRALLELRELPQIVGGLTEAAADRAAQLFGRCTNTVVKVASLEAAEMIKIMDNTHRDLVFAYANQIAVLCEALGLDMVPLVRAANHRYARNSIPLPSPGVGGACLSKDPYILADLCRAAGVDPALFLLGRSVNEGMPIHVCDRLYADLRDIGKELAGAEVFVLGFAFKGHPETSDLRNSPTLDLLRALSERGALVRGHDPLVTADELAALGVRPCSLEDGFHGADAAVVMLNHPMYAELNIAAMTKTMDTPGVIVDGWRLYDPDTLADVPDIIYRSVGR
jgi:UDP-N-acetyl-D-mannosaminuronic acid dehydrogenase